MLKRIFLMVVALLGAIGGAAWAKYTERLGEYAVYFEWMDTLLENGAEAWVNVKDEAKDTSPRSVLIAVTPFVLFFLYNKFWKKRGMGESAVAAIARRVLDEQRGEIPAAPVSALAPVEPDEPKVVRRAVARGTQTQLLADQQLAQARHKEVLTSLNPLKDAARKAGKEQLDAEAAAKEKKKIRDKADADLAAAEKQRSDLDRELSEIASVLKELETAVV